MKAFKYYLKQTLIIYLYLLITMISSLAVAAINKSLLWLQIILCVLNIALFGFIVFIFISKTGEDSYKLKHTNDIKRRVIMETGDYYEFDLIKEHNPLKGVYIGICASAPLIIMLLVQAVLDICGVSQSVISAIIAFTYGTFFIPLRIIETSISVYFSIYAAAVLIALTHFGYMFGVKKIKKQHDKIAKTNELIYGKKRK